MPARDCRTPTFESQGLRILCPTGRSISSLQRWLCITWTTMARPIFFEGGLKGSAQQLGESTTVS
jgi:hypothetical protein